MAEYRKEMDTSTPAETPVAAPQVPALRAKLIPLMKKKIFKPTTRVELHPGSPILSSSTGLTVLEEYKSYVRELSVHRTDILQFWRVHKYPHGIIISLISVFRTRRTIFVGRHHTPWP